MTREKKAGMKEPKEIRTLHMIASEHNRAPGFFDYNYP